MKQVFKRWYEKDQYILAFMNLLHDMPVEEQCEIAVDIIIEASSMLDREYTNLIKDVREFNPKDFKRWYDKNPNIHVAIEALRELEPNQREQIIQGLSEKILSYQTKNNDNPGEKEC